MARWRSPPESWCGYSRARSRAPGPCTWSSISIARSHATRRPTPACACTAAAIWSPIVKTGLSDVIGSWNTMAMRAPRTRRMASSSLSSRSSPSRRTRPAVMRPGAGTSRMIDSDVTLLPQPDSPTRPSISPRSIEKLMPSTARTAPALVSNCVRRPSTASNATALDLEPRIERVAQPVTEQVDGEHGQHDREAGKRRQPPRRRHVVAAVGQHPSPRRRGRLDAEPEKRERGLVDDHEGELERGHDDDRCERIRQHVMQQQPQRSVAPRARAGHELALAQGQDVRTHDTSELNPARGAHDQDDVDQTRAEREDDPHGEP